MTSLRRTQCAGESRMSKQSKSVRTCAIPAIAFLHRYADVGGFADSYVVRVDGAAAMFSSWRVEQQRPDQLLLADFAHG